MFGRIVAGLLSSAVVLAPHANAADHSRDSLWEAMVTYGPGICTALHSEAALTALTDADAKLVKAGFTEAEAGAIMGDALTAFCPDEIAAVKAAVSTN